MRIAPPTKAGRYGTELDAAMHDFERSVVRIKGVDPVTTELVRLRCARIHDCRRCRSVRDDAALEAGFDEALGAKIDDYEQSDLSPRHKAALRLADAMILGAPIDPRGRPRPLHRVRDRRTPARRRQVERPEGTRRPAHRAGARRRAPDPDGRRRRRHLPLRSRPHAELGEVDVLGLDGAGRAAGGGLVASSRGWCGR